MCGIIACSSPNNLNRNDVRLGMLMADDRGGHSTGFTDGYNILRVVDNAKGFFKTEGGDTINIPDKFSQFIGHTRWATEGDKNLTNTHPFNLPDALGVHNGAIDNFDDLKKDYGDDALEKLREVSDRYNDLDEIESDSALLYYLIDRYGLRDAVKQTKGSMGLVYFDSDKTMHVYRYDKPLCYGFKGQELWIGSMRRYLASLGCHNIKPFTQHCHFKIKNGNVIDSKQLKNRNAPEDKKSKWSDDFDPDFSKEDQLKGYPEKKSKGKSQSNNNGGRSTSNSDGSGKTIITTDNEQTRPFKAPMYAKAGYVDGNLLLWWFSRKSHSILYLEVEGYDDVISYDLSNEQERTVMGLDFPEIEEDVLDEYTELELAAEEREENSKNVIYQ